MYYQKDPADYDGSEEEEEVKFDVSKALEKLANAFNFDDNSFFSVINAIHLSHHAKNLSQTSIVGN